MPKLPPHVNRVLYKGRPYYYLARNRGTDKAAKPIRLPDNPNSPEFWAAYAQHMQLPAPRIDANAVRLLVGTWQASPEWAALSPRTKVEWAHQCRVIVAAWGDLQVRGLEPHHVLALRDARADTPASTNNLLRCLSSMLGWGVPRRWLSANPCREVRKLKAGEGYAPWPWEVITAARDELLADGRPDLWWVVALALYTGQRLSDVLAMRWDAISRVGACPGAASQSSDGRTSVVSCHGASTISVKQGKTGKQLAIALHRDLQAVLATIPRRAVTIATSTDGTPWRGGFQTAWRKHRPKAVSTAGLVFHGLRKSAVVTLLEAGCTEAETAAVTGQSARMVEHYARQVNQEKLAAAAILKWERAGNGG